MENDLQTCIDLLQQMLEEDYALVVAKNTQAGTHGFLPDSPDMLGTCIIWGYGVKPGTNLGKISNQDVAPTMAKFLDVEFPSADGKVLKSALK